MSTRILVNVDHGETRVAVLEDSRVVDFAIERDDRLVGNVYKGRVVNVLPGMDAAFVDVGLSRNAFIYVTDVSPEARSASQHGEESARHYESITEALQVGEEILVQISRPPIGTKGARVTTHISLPGRYVVLVTRSTRHVGISRNIEEENERDRLRRIVERYRPLDHGIILRTEADGRSEAELRQDIESLATLWKTILERFNQVSAPCEIHRDLGLIGRVARDMLTDEVTELLIDSSEDLQRLAQVLQRDAPHLVSKMKLYEGTLPLFEQFELEADLAKVLAHVVPLPRGGHITIDETEALTSIDVDTGKYVGKTHLSETVLQTNLEAVEEVARQLRLRDIGGIIVIDFIDMDRVKDRIRVMNELQKAVKKDRTRTKIIYLSPLGLVEMTRRRRGVSLSELLCRRCPYCSGRGRIRSAETVTIELRRKIRRMARRVDDEALLVRCHPEVAALLVGPDGDVMRELEKDTGKEIYVQVEPEGHLERSDLRPGTRVAVIEMLPPLSCHAAFTLDRHTPTYPANSLAFTTLERHLIELPELDDVPVEPIKLHIEDVGRWFAVASLGEEPTDYSL